MRRRASANADGVAVRAAMIEHYERDIAERGKCAEMLYGRVLAALVDGSPVTLPGWTLANYVPESSAAAGTFDVFCGYTLHADGQITAVAS